MSHSAFGWVGALVLAGVALTGVALAGERPLPRHVDLTAEFQKAGFAPQLQGSRDTCSLFAVTALAEFECARSGASSDVRLSEEFLIWAANESTGLTGDQAMFYEAAHGLNALGVCSADLMPYAKTSDPARKPSSAALADAKGRSERWQVHWIRRWNQQRPLSDSELAAIKDALADGHPVACGLRWPKNLRGHELLKVPRASNVFDGHSIAFMGYQDDPDKPGGGVFVFRNSDGPRWGDHGSGVMSYAYAVAYANDALWLHLGSPNSEVPLHRFQAESRAVLAKGRCEVGPQDMKQWGGRMWSKGTQLLCQAKEGGFVELGFTVAKGGRYRLRVLATAGPDFGTVRIALDGAPRKEEFDLYSGRVCPAGSLELGTVELAAGRHNLRFTAVGKCAASSNYFFGLDTIDLLAAK